jgi:hypothetical protein
MNCLMSETSEGILADFDESVRIVRFGIVKFAGDFGVPRCGVAPTHSRNARAAERRCRARLNAAWRG